MHPAILKVLGQRRHRRVQDLVPVGLVQRLVQGYRNRHWLVPSSSGRCVGAGRR